MSVLRRMVYTMRLFLAGGVSGNLKPAWTVASRTGATMESFERAIYENFWQGGKVGISYSMKCMAFRP